VESLSAIFVKNILAQPRHHIFHEMERVLSL
jgi:hypothetical protein